MRCSNCLGARHKNVLCVSVWLLALLGYVGAAYMDGQCFWFTPTSPSNEMRFTDEELTAWLGGSATIENCTTGMVPSLLSTRPQADQWLVLVANSTHQHSSNDVIVLDNISQFILTSWEDVVLACQASPEFDTIDTDKIISGLAGNGYSIDRSGSGSMLAIRNSTDVLLTGLTFQKCISNDAEPAALMITNSTGIRINHCLFSDNFGPAVASFNTSISLFSTTFRDNVRFGSLETPVTFNPNQGSSGLIIQLSGLLSYQVTIENCTFHNNINTQGEFELDDVARSRGGHSAAATILMKYAEGRPLVTVANSTFTQNAARQFAGGLYADFEDTVNATFEVSGCNFTGNGAETLAGGLFVCLASNASDNNITVHDTTFEQNIAGLGGGFVVLLISQDTLPRFFDTPFLRFSNDLSNDTFHVSVPSENFIFMHHCSFASNLARGAGNAFALLMRLQVTTSPLPARIDNCQFTGHAFITPTPPPTPSGYSRLYADMQGLIYHPHFLHTVAETRMFVWSAVKCIVMCDKFPILFGSGETSFLTNYMRSVVIQSSAIYVEGRLVVSGNVNTQTGTFNLENYGAGIVLTSRSQMYVANTSDLVFSDNYSGFGAALYSLTSLASASFATGIDDIFSHRCFIIFNSNQFAYPSASSSSLANFTFVNNTAWKGSAIYAASMLDCAGWWRSRNCITEYPETFKFEGNKACGFDGFPQYGECRKLADTMPPGNPTECGSRTAEEALENYNIFCPPIATNAYQEHWQLPPWTSTNRTEMTFSPGQTIEAEAVLIDQNCNPSELNTKLQASPSGVVDFQHVHFEVNGRSSLPFVSYSADYPFAGPGPSTVINTTLQPLVSTFAENDYIILKVGECRAGYLPNQTSAGHYTCQCMGTDNIVQACANGSTAIVLKGNYWATNSSPVGNLTYHRCPWGFCKPYCSDRDLAAYGSGSCCESSPSHRGCLFDSTKPNSLCNSNRSGVLCGSCPPGLAIVHTQWIVDCVDCSHRAGLIAIMVLLPAAFVLLLIFLDVHLPHYAWVFVHYIQVSSYLPNSSNDRVFVPIQYLQFYTSLDFMYGACLLEDLDGLENSAVFFIPLAAITATTLIVYIITVSVDRKKRRKWTARCRKALLSGFQLMYFNLWIAVYRVILCANIGFASGSEERLIVNGDVRCWEGRHLTYAIPSLLFLGLVLVPAPFALIAFNRSSVKSKSAHRQKNWFGYNEGVGSIWWFSWDMVRKAAVVLGYAIFEVSLRQSVRFIVFLVDLTLTRMLVWRTNYYRSNEHGWWVDQHHSIIQGISLVVLSMLQLLWLGFFLTTQDPAVPVELMSTLESLPIAIMALWLAWSVFALLFHRYCLSTDKSGILEGTWSDLSRQHGSKVRSSVRQRLIATVTASVNVLNSEYRRSDDGRSVHRDRMPLELDSDILLGGRTPIVIKRDDEYHRMAESDSDSCND